jgi:hypothetical protein
MDAVLDRGVLGRQAEGVPPERVQHVEPRRRFMRAITSPMM